LHPTRIREMKMKKRTFLLLIVFCTISLQAQKCDSIARHIVENIKNYLPDDLLPYYDKTSNEWGLMSKDGKILTQPIQEYPSEITFNPDFKCILWSKWCSILINRKDYSYVAVDSTEEHAQVIPRTNNNPSFHGFKTYENSKTISEYSNRYTQINDNAFIYNKKLYAIAQFAENKKYGAIDQEGNPLPFLDFKFKSLNLVREYKNKTQFWFYFEDEKGQKGFINTKGETQFYGQLLSYVFGSGFYDVQNSEKQSGVLNLRTLKWTIKPQEKLKIENTIITIGQDKENFTYYVVVSEGDEKYLIDMRKKVYKPIK